MQVTVSSDFRDCREAINLGGWLAVKERLCGALLTKLLILAFAILVQLVWPIDLAAQNCSPYSDFQNMTDAQLATLQVKLVYVGASRGIMSSLVVTATGNTPDPTLFSLCVREGSSDPAPTTFSASIAELRAILNNVATLPGVTAGGTAANPFLAFSLANSQPTNKVFEAILDTTTAASLFIQLRKSLSNNKAATLVLSRTGCSLGLNAPGTPTNITSGFSVSLSGIRLNRSANTFVSTMTVTNNSGSTPAAPVSVVLDLPINVTIVNPDGITCVTDLPGRGFVNLSSIPAAGQSVSMPIQFNNPDLETLTFKTRVFAGPGAR